MATVVSESRGDLLNWINDLLQLNVAKIEQVGTGGNVALHKVKFSTHNEYEYVQNFKVLQAAFLQNGIDKVHQVIVNEADLQSYPIEFLQWVKKFWDTNYPGGQYDAVGRRGGKSWGGQVEPSRLRATQKMQQSQSASMAAAVAPRQQAFSSRPASTVPSSSLQNRSSVPANEAKVERFMKEVAELRLAIDEAENERDFYFQKLREIEIEAQRLADAGQDSVFVKKIMEIMYRTEEGYEMPADESATATQ